MLQKYCKWVLAALFVVCTGLMSAFSEIPPIYVGAEAGYGMSTFALPKYGSADSKFGGFEITPVIGTYPFGTRDFGIELNVQMAFLDCKDEGVSGVDYSTITPQLVAVYNFTAVPYLQPYIGAGIGYNINNLNVDYGDTGEYSYEDNLKNSFSFIAKGGLRFNIPGTTMLMLLYGKYNLNNTVWTINEYTYGYLSDETSYDVRLGTFSFGLGFGYIF